MAAPGNEKTDQASKPEGPKAPSAPAPKAAAAVAPAKPAPRKGGLVSKLVVAALALLALAGAAGYAALTFRDADPRLGVAAAYVDEGVSEARALLDKGQALVAELTGETAKPDAEQSGARARLDKAPLAAPEQPAPAEAAPEKAPEAALPAAEPRPDAVAPEAAKPIEAPPADVKPVEKPAESAAADAKKIDARPPEAKPLEPKPIEAAPIESRSAEAKPMEPAPVAAAAPVAKTAGVDADGFSDRDLISALEGRIDALSDEVKALRDRLDAPKNETRAAPEAEAPKPAPAPAAADTSGASVVLAFALQRDLEAGRPFADEIAAFSRLGAEPAPSPALIDLAEKGAPTGAQLREAFLPVAKALRAHESHGQDSGALTDHLLQGASKLVKVRPTGEAEPESLDGKLHRIEAALTHNDFAAALSLYDSLPEAARAESKEFGATLRQRAEAARAADELLHGAIAALGKK
jgi:hypothetical protein